MAGRIPQQFIDELLTRVDIVDVIDERVTLRKAGREYTACCPFHNEKTPSFTVSPDKQFYHCFGCGMHGSAISFLMEYERLEFVDAIEELAQRAGLQVPRESGVVFEAVDKDSYDVLDQAARFFQQQLKQAAQADRAVEYLKQRGLSGETAANFGVGYAPEGWDNLIQAMRGKGISEKQLLDAGLVIKRDNGGYYDRFRDRIMFPIRDRRGRVIAFGGRVLSDEDTPKYLNSPETSLFHKGRELYGLYEARQANRQLTHLVVVEGYMDVVSLAQFGVTCGVATLGTATTPEHLERIFRVVPSTVFCFDGDRAGREAAWRALTNTVPVVKEGRQIDFMFLPQGEDPDSIVRSEGQQGFEDRMQQAIPFSQFFFDGLSDKLDLGIPEGRAMLIERARPLLVKLTPGIFQVMMLDRLAELTRMSPDKLSAQLALTKGNASQDQPARRRVTKPDMQGLSPVRLAIRLLVEDPQLAALVELSRLRDLSLPGVLLLIELLELAQQKPTITCGALLEHWRDREDGRHLARLLQLPLTVPADGLEPEFLGAIDRLAEQRAGQRADELLEKSRHSRLSPEEEAELTRVLTGK